MGTGFKLVCEDFIFFEYSSVFFKKCFEEENFGGGHFFFQLIDNLFIDDTGGAFGIGAGGTDKINLPKFCINFNFFFADKNQRFDFSYHPFSFG